LRQAAAVAGDDAVVPLTGKQGVVRFVGLAAQGKHFVRAGAPDTVPDGAIADAWSRPGTAADVRRMDQAASGTARGRWREPAADTVATMPSRRRHRLRPIK
jgi:hypothetical protein